MTTPAMFKAIDAFANVFQRFGKPPLQWNRGRKDFFVTKTISAGSLIWHFNVFGILMCLNGSCSLSVLGTQLFRQEMTMPVWKILVILIFTLLEGFSIGVSFVLAFQSETLMTFYNQLADLEKVVPKASKSQKNGGAKEKRDAIGFVLMLLVYLFAFYPVMLLGLVVYDLEPVYNFCNELLPKAILDPGTVYYLPLLVFRFIVTFLSVYEGCRLFPLVFILAVTVCRTCHHIIDQLKAATSLSESIDNIKLYRQLELIMKVGENINQVLLAILLGSGLCLSVGFNYATLRMYDTLPSMVYPYFPSVSCFIPLIIHCLVPFAIKIHAEGKVLVRRQWGHELAEFESPRSRRYIIAKVRSIRIIRLYCGIAGYRLFPMERPFKMRYYEAILTFTVNALLS